jgi:hypothetical protein
MPERWLDPGITGLRAELCQVQSTREEFALLFGTRSGGKARLERRILVSPTLAKQLAAALAGIGRDPNATPAGGIESSATDADAPAGARPMLELVRALGVGFGFEKSFKLNAGSAQGERVILGVRTERAPRKALLRICRELGMSKAHLEQFEALLPEANTVGFGFEGGSKGGAYKVYLEFWERMVQRLRRDPTNRAPRVLFLGYKWPVRGGGRTAIAEYTCHPLLAIEAIARRLAALYPGDSPSLGAAQEILQLAAARLGPNDSFVYVEAAEEGNPRRSFDLNFYKVGLRVGDLRGPLSRLCERYSIKGAQLESLLEQSGARPFGHLSGGLGREGEDFLTVYYEIEGL